MPIRLHDSLTRELRELRPSHPDGVFRFYNCGPTVYAPAHIGNFRTFVVNDVLRRLLELEFGPDKVKHVRNLTDVDDKTIRRAREENRPLADVTAQWTDKFHADCAALNCLPPHEEPRATDPRFLREQVSMIECLMEKGNAYRAADGSVYFKVSSFPGYGALSRVKERELQIGSALAGKSAAADADEKEDGSDFALWKAWKPDDGANQWPGPRGAAPGRPGWHIECSAMSKALLGETIDLHTGGVDLLFPHHENEIAQSECCNGQPFARHWYHSEHLLVDGKKMSKSLGNLYTLNDLNDKGFTPEVVRLALLQGHPRKQLNFTLDSLHAAKSAYEKLTNFRTTLGQRFPIFPKAIRPSARFDSVIVELKKDLNFPGALGELFSIIAALPANEASVEDYRAFDLVVLQLLGLPVFISVMVTPEQEALIKAGADTQQEKPAFTVPPPAPLQIPEQIAKLAGQRWAAKAAKDFASADALRKELTAAGWAMLDGKDGYKLEPLKK
jgi:cysteinyl-tRNA synthetase